jgi:Putative zinc-finger
MKCEACLNRLEEYIDGELVEHDAEQISAHLITCGDCSSAFDGLASEQEVYARYDRDLEVSPSMWNLIETRIAGEEGAIASSSRSKLRNLVAVFFVGPRLGFAFAGATAILIAAIVMGVVYIRIQKESRIQDLVVAVQAPNDVLGLEAAIAPSVKHTGIESRAQDGAMWEQSRNVRNEKPNGMATKPTVSRHPNTRSLDQNDVFYSAVANSDAEDFETQRHIERAQNLLRSIRNAEVPNDEEAVDVSYEKALARRLLTENIVLRREAEANGRFPVKTLLSSLEPFLIDIANLQDQSTPDELSVVKDRVRKTEIVAALQSH